MKADAELLNELERLIEPLAIDLDDVNDDEHDPAEIAETAVAVRIEIENLIARVRLGVVS